LDGGAWQNASLSSTSDQNAWHDPTFQGYWNQQDCNYTAVLQGLSNGEHALNVSLTPKLQYCYRYTDNGLELIYNVGEDAYDINADAAINFHVEGNHDAKTPGDQNVTAGQELPLIGYVAASAVTAASVTGIFAIVKRRKHVVR
jgi:hypothetical protein